MSETQHPPMMVLSLLEDSSESSSFPLLACLTTSWPIPNTKTSHSPVRWSKLSSLTCWITMSGLMVSVVSPWINHWMKSLRVVTCNQVKLQNSPRKNKTWAISVWNTCLKFKRIWYLFQISLMSSTHLYAKSPQGKRSKIRRSQKHLRKEKTKEISMKRLQRWRKTMQMLRLRIQNTKNFKVRFWSK